MNKWTEQNNRLIKLFEFKNFEKAFAFMTAVASVAEKMDHHPTWTNSWNKVYIELNTHSTGGNVTEKDWALAQAIDKIENESNG
ncbi:MAG: 4a-hydroxytetrahydrobiopterin dehydratase [Cytophaga sp.]|uniref:4a-hydroxytetrahydrobiopterin dehydratase n=1 Tax=Cytophaga sp. TaxID=29535 RepID=UPI003F7F8189